MKTNKHLKTKAYLLRLTADEHKLLIKKANELGIPLSNYLRIKIVNLLKTNINK